MYSLPTLHGPFDIIFIDADKKDYVEIYDMIMERRLLAQDGIILADNVLALGCTVDSNFGTPHDAAVRNGAELRKFNDRIAEVLTPPPLPNINPVSNACVFAGRPR